MLLSEQRAPKSGHCWFFHGGPLASEDKLEHEGLAMSVKLAGAAKLDLSKATELHKVSEEYQDRLKAAIAAAQENKKNLVAFLSSH